MICEIFLWFQVSWWWGDDENAWGVDDWKMKNWNREDCSLEMLCSVLYSALLVFRGYFLACRKYFPGNRKLGCILLLDWTMGRRARARARGCSTNFPFDCSFVSCVISLNTFWWIWDLKNKILNISVHEKNLDFNYFCRFIEKINFLLFHHFFLEIVHSWHFHVTKSIMLLP